MINENSLQPPAECPNKTESTTQESMQQWLDQALNSNDIRDRIAVTSGVSRGMFGHLPIAGLQAYSPLASNDDEFTEAQKQA